MKIKTVVFLTSMALTSGCATAQDTGAIFSTVIGGVAGYELADHLGGSDSEQAIGAVVGAVAGNAILNHSRAHRASRGYYETYHYEPVDTTFANPVYVESRQVYVEPRRGGSFYSRCSRQVPGSYAVNSGARSAWISGCENRMRQHQAELEEQAYMDGMR